MQKKIVIGPAGCGKTHRLIGEFAQKIVSSGSLFEDEFYFLVPSAEHTKRVISLLMDRLKEKSLHGFFQKRVTTLSQLITNLLPDVSNDIISDAERREIILKILNTNEIDFFKSAMRSEQFSRALGEFILELKEANLDEISFREKMNNIKKHNKSFETKYEALAVFFELYNAELTERKLLERQDKVRKFLNKSTHKFKELWLDGFFDFSNLQIEIIKKLSECTDKITVTITADTARNSRDFFKVTDRIKEELKKIGFIEEETTQENKRTSDKALAELSKKIFCSSKKEKKFFDTGNIKILESVGLEGEIEQMARQIYFLKKENPARYLWCDFAVLFRQIGQYARIIESVFDRYGIPVEIHEREKTKADSFFAAIKHFLLIFQEDGWQRENIFGFLKSPYVQNKNAGKDFLEKKTEIEGVFKGKENWIKDWARGGDDENIKVNNEKKEIFKELERIEGEFYKAKSVREHIGILKSAIYETFKMCEVNNSYTKENLRNAASVKRLDILLKEIQNSFFSKRGDISFKEFSERLLKIIDVDVYSVHAREENRVHIYGVSLARQKEYKVVFVAGIEDGVFPQLIRENPFLSDEERRVLNVDAKDNGGKVLREQLPKSDIERYLFYIAITRASEKLFLSFSYTDFHGKKNLASSFLQEVKDVFDGKIEILHMSPNNVFLSPENAITLREKERAFIGGFYDKSKKQTAENLPKNRETLNRLSLATQDIEKPENIKVPIEPQTLSPSRLEVYAQCPYRYFAGKVLRLEDITDDGIAAKKGIVIHAVLKQYFETDKKTGEILREFIKKAMEEEFGKINFAWKSSREEFLLKSDLIEKLAKFIEWMELESAESRAGVLPSKTEFGLKGLPLDVDGEKSILIKGTVDRIDTDAKKNAYVIDYKTSKRFEAKKLSIGTALQLPLYLVAVADELKLTPAAGEIFNVNNKKRSGFYNNEIVKKEYFGQKGINCSSNDFKEKILNRALAFSKKYAREILASKFPARPREKCPEYCAYGDLCRLSEDEKTQIPKKVQEEDKNDPFLREFFK